MSTYPTSERPTPSQRPKSTPRIQHSPKKRSRSTPEALHPMTTRRMTTDAATMRKTLVENVKESLRERKAMGVSRDADSASSLSEAEIGLGSTGADSASSSPKMQRGLGSTGDAETVDEDYGSNKNESHSAESPATCRSEPHSALA